VSKVIEQTRKRHRGGRGIGERARDKGMVVRTRKAIAELRLPERPSSCKIRRGSATYRPKKSTWLHQA